MLFKTKYKKSEWYKGLLECEKSYKEGMRLIPSEGTVHHLWLTSEDGNFKIGLDVYKNFHRVVGHLDYIRHYENNLKNIENNQDCY